MATIVYTFRPSLFTGERTITLDNSGIAEATASNHRRIPWTSVQEVHVEPATSGDDGGSRFVIHVRASGQRQIDIDSVNVRGAADFEHKDADFADLLRFIH